MTPRNFTIGILDFNFTENNELKMELVDRQEVIKIAQKYNLVFTLGFFVGTLMQNVREAIEVVEPELMDVTIAGVYNLTAKAFIEAHGTFFRKVLTEFEQYLSVSELAMTRNFISIVEG